ncbi:transcriptional regulator [Streptomyces chartreusis]|uniref:transcriptional regulator n=1 Tax=Streptomyces chartreusis TaxID=1969 RepID=UPI003810A9D0
MSRFPAIDALLAAHTPLPPPAERGLLRRRLGLTAGEVAQAIGVDAATLHAWEEGLTEPEAHLRAAYAYLLTRARASADDRSQAPAPDRTTDIETLTQPAPCVLCGKPATHQVLGYPQHFNPAECTAAPHHTPRNPSSHQPAPAATGHSRAPRPVRPPTSQTDMDSIAAAVTAARRAHTDNPDAAVHTLVSQAIPDAMRLFNACRVGGRYDVVSHPALPDILRKPSSRAPSLIWEARPNWQRPHPLASNEPITVLDINGAYLSAFKTHLPIGHLQPTAPTPHDRRRAGVHLITPPAWEHENLPNPLGARQEPGPVWITEPTLRLLLRLAGPRHALCEPPVVHESYTSGSTENLLEKFRTMLRDARIRALEEGDTVTLEYVKAMYSKFVATMGESSYNKELRRPDWMHLIRSQAFANLWTKAYKAHTHGVPVLRVCGTDELHLQGDWRHVFREGKDLSEVKVKDTYPAGTHRTSPAGPDDLTDRSAGRPA